MTKTAFAAIAALGCALMGMLYAQSLRRRARSLRGWARAAAKIEAGLARRAHTLEEMIEDAAKGEESPEVRGCLESCAAQMRADPLLSLSQAMEAQPMPELTGEDRATLAPLWHGLGAGEEQAQRGLLQSVQQALALQMQEAQEKEAKDRRLYLSLGTIGGLMVFLFLL